MAEEPSLPQFPAVSWNCETQSFDNTRKRARDGGHESAEAHHFANSSDPAMFSSDDDPHLENYTQEGRHRKKRYVGSWFQQHPASGDSAFSEELKLPRPVGKRIFQRTADSGVWMGSDGSTDLELDEPLQLPTTSRLLQLNNVSRQPAAISRAEEHAREKIFDAVEDGDEDLDLTSMSLKELSNATIAPLSELACIPTVTPGVPFDQKDPALKIYLSSNPLSKVPGAIFNLQHLTYLSLRSTEITELPPAIGQLRNLVTLNVSMTRLRYLPGELLDLIKYPSKLKQLLIQPNPFYEPTATNEGSLDTPEVDEEAEWEDSSDPLVIGEFNGKESCTKLWLQRQELSRPDDHYPRINGNPPTIWRARIRARTPLHFEDCHGVTTSRFSLPDHRLDSEKLLAIEALTLPPATPAAQTVSSTSKTSSRVPSLLELALRSCSRTSQLQYLPSYLPDDAPPHLSDLLRRIVEQADTNANSGNLPCSNCGKRVIVPAARWIEWWDLRKIKIQSDPIASIAFHAGIVPFMKRACSYGCLPEAMDVNTLLPGTLRFNAHI